MFLPLFFFAVTAAIAPAQPQPQPPPEEETLPQLLTIRRVFIDRLTGGETADQMRDMISSALQSTGLFVITENRERADAILRGAAEDLVYTDVHTSSDSIHADAHFGFSNADSTSNSTSGFAGFGGHTSDSQRDSRSRNGGMSAGDSESTHSVERRHEAVAAVRLVNKDGDVIWSTTQESLGGKFRGSSVDVADKITKKLLADYERARKLGK